MPTIKESFYNKLDEMRKEKLVRYVNRAAADWAQREKDAGRDEASGYGTDYNYQRKRWNREQGIDRATRKLSKGK